MDAIPRIEERRKYKNNKTTERQQLRKQVNKEVKKSKVT